MYRTIESVEYKPEAERDDNLRDSVLGDVTYVRFVECGHLLLGNPSMSYKVGGICKCWKCK